LSEIKLPVPGSVRLIRSGEYFATGYGTGGGWTEQVSENTLVLVLQSEIVEDESTILAMPLTTVFERLPQGYDVIERSPGENVYDVADMEEKLEPWLELSLEQWQQALV
jgi:hypothetical protein